MSADDRMLRFNLCIRDPHLGSNQGVHPKYKKELLFTVVIEKRFE